MPPKPTPPTAPPPRKPGRPTKATPTTLAILADAIATGLTDEQAADLAGLAVSTVRAWRTAEGEFSAAVKKATALRLAARLARIEAGAPGWQGVAWILERTMRGQFAPPTARQDLSHSGGLHHTTARLSEEENARLREARRRMLARMEADRERGTPRAEGSQGQPLAVGRLNPAHGERAPTAGPPHPSASSSPTAGWAAARRPPRRPREAAAGLRRQRLSPAGRSDR